MRKKDIIIEILKIEWEFFDNTQNLNGRASCQNHKYNFLLSRYAYLDMYNLEILSSYLQDFIMAKRKNINLVMQKYGYMMQFTDPKNYENIKKNLIFVSSKKQSLIDKIVPIFLNWTLEAQNSKNIGTTQYLNRALHSTKDMKTSTSAQTYITGELKTYSTTTLELILCYFFLQNNKGNNLILLSNYKLENNEYTIDFL